MIVGLDAIAQLVRRYAIVEALYLQDVDDEASRGLKVEVLKLYGAILEYQARVICHLDSSVLAQTTSHITGKISWSDQRTVLREIDTVCMQALALADSSQAFQQGNMLNRILAQQNDIIQESIVESKARGNGLLDELQKQRNDFRKWTEGQEARDCKRILRTSDYEMMKNRNPSRAAGTCNWFLRHQNFQDWLDEPTSACLWVTADPGCGKSVLCRYLIDEYLTPIRQTGATVCYFFFKDGDFSASVNHTLCALLHQLVCANERLLKAVREQYDSNLDKLPSLFEPLWKAFVATITHADAGHIVCVLDALDECEVGLRLELVRRVKSLFAGGLGTANFKLLISSRFTTQIRDAVYDFDTKKLAVVRLTGEAPTEMHILHGEINAVVAGRIRRFAQLRNDLYNIHDDAAALLAQRMSKVENRTYLWVSLVFPELERAAGQGQSALMETFNTIPTTVYDAYQRILERSSDSNGAKRLLRVILAARRPLVLKELKFTYLFEYGAAKQCFDEVSTDAFRTMVREVCGLFIRFDPPENLHGSLEYDLHAQSHVARRPLKDDLEKVSLIHQTAREFLTETTKLKSHLEMPVSRSWQHSLHGQESDERLGKLCLQALLEARKMGDNLSWDVQWFADRYAEANWREHVRTMPNDNLNLLDLSLELCWHRTKSLGNTTQIGEPHVLITSIFWDLPLLWKHFSKSKRHLLNSIDIQSGRLPITAAFTANKSDCIAHLCRIGGIDFNLQDEHGDSGLFLAVQNQDSFEDDIGLSRLLEVVFESGNYLHPIDFSQVDAEGRNALHVAIAETNDVDDGLANSALVLRHNTRTAGVLNVNHTDSGGSSFLHYLATYFVDPIRTTDLIPEGVVQDLTYVLSQPQLDVNLANNMGQTPLWVASWVGNEEITRALLQVNDIDVDAADEWGRTPLLACLEAHDEGQRAFGCAYQLIHKGADPNVVDLHGRTALTLAIRKHMSPIIEMLVLDCAAIDCSLTDWSGWTPLMLAAVFGKSAIIYDLFELCPERGLDLEMQHLAHYLNTLEGYENVTYRLGQHVPKLSSDMVEIHNSWVRHCLRMELLPIEATLHRFLTVTRTKSSLRLKELR